MVTQNNLKLLLIYIRTPIRKGVYSSYNGISGTGWVVGMHLVRTCEFCVPEGVANLYNLSSLGRSAYLCDQISS